MAAGDPTAALHKLADALALDPSNDDTRHDYARLLLQLGELDEAGAILEPKMKEVPRQLRFEALWHYLDACVLPPPTRAASGRPSSSTPPLRRTSAISKPALPGPACWWQRVPGRLPWTSCWRSSCATKPGTRSCHARPSWPFWNCSPPKPKTEVAAPGKSAGGIELMGKSATVEDPQAQLVSGYRRKLSMALN